MQLATLNGQAVTMTSREIAELTGKEHRHVLRDIEVMLQELDLNKEGYAQTWTHPQNGQKYPEFALDRELTETLLTGYSAVLRRKVIARWRELEQQVAKPLITLPGDYIEALEQLLITKKSEQSAIAERDHAIATKAQIGSKREATAMANVAKANREVARLMDRLGNNTRHATVKAVEKAAGKRFDWAPLRRWCTAHAVIAEDVPDPLYGSVKSWPADAWGEIYGIDLQELFATTQGA